MSAPRSVHDPHRLRRLGIAATVAITGGAVALFLFRGDPNEPPAVDPAAAPAATDSPTGPGQTLVATNTTGRQPLQEGPTTAREAGREPDTTADPFVVDCVDEFERPVAGARVSPREVDGAVLAWGGTDHAVVTAADGRARLVLAAAQQLRVRATKGYLLGDSGSLTRAAPGRVVMARTPAVEILVLDATGEICGQPCLGEMWHVEQPKLVGLDSAPTGQLQIGLPCEGTFYGQVYTGLQVLEVPQVSVESGQVARVVVRRPVGRALRLRLFAPDGRPTTAVDVEPDARESRLRRQNMPTPSGLFELPGSIRDAALVLRGDSGDFAVLTIDGEGRPSCPEWEGDIGVVRLEPPVTFEITLADACPAKAAATLTSWQSAGDRTIAQRRTLSFGSRKTQRLTAMAGTYHAWLTGGTLPVLQSFSGVAAPGQTVSVHLGEGLRPVRLRFVDDHGTPVPGVAVDIRTSGPGRVNGKVVRLQHVAAATMAVADSDGAVALLLEGTSMLSILAVDARFWPRRQQVVVGDHSSAVVRMCPLVTVSGRVRRAGQPCVAHVALLLTGDTAAVEYGGRRTAADGTFHIQGPKGHAVTLLVTSGGRRRELALGLDAKSEIDIGDIEVEGK